jgi:hypothetical protein
MSPRRLPATALRLAVPIALLLAALPARPAHAETTWGNYGANAQHTAVSSMPAQPLGRVVWQTPVDLNPQYTGTVLYIHYGSPLLSPGNTVIIPVKVGAADSFRVEARSGANGSLLWQFDSDYLLPPYNWVPSYCPTLTPNGRLFMAGGGGTLFHTDNVDAPGPHTFTRVAFYGIANYNLNPAAFDADVRVCTPLTSDSRGNVFFGFRASGVNPLGLVSGLARIDVNGTGSFVTAGNATGGLAQQVGMNCAPAVSNDGNTVYVGMRLNSSSRGYLVAVNAATLAPRAVATLFDPVSGTFGRVANDGTASPMIAPDDRVYFGILENPSFSNAARGWLLQFDAALNLAGPPAAFGWDDTPSLVPRSSVPSYQGASSYLLMAKYNFYAGAGGDGVNKLAILDPNDSQIDPFSGATVMKEILTIAGVTPDSDFIDTYPNAVREWCINTAAIDTFTHSVLAGAEDGVVYRWSLDSNTFTQSLRVTPGLGEAYTPTLIGRDGKVYAINNAMLFAIGGTNGLGVGDGESPDRGVRFSAIHPNPFADETSIGFSLPRAESVRLAILDIGGRRVASLVDRDLPAGSHAARWDGRDASGRRVAAGVYLAVLEAGPETVTRVLVSLR